MAEQGTVAVSAQARVARVPERAVLAQEPVERVRVALPRVPDQVPVRAELAVAEEVVKFFILA